jgi:hypothetical protein
MLNVQSSEVRERYFYKTINPKTYEYGSIVRRNGGRGGTTFLPRECPGDRGVADAVVPVNIATEGSKSSGWQS